MNQIVEENEASMFERVLDMIAPLEEGVEEINFDIISWPYSRKLIAIFCIDREIIFSYERLNKKLDRFTFSLTEDDLGTIKKALKVFNKEAKRFSSENEVNITEARNLLVNDFLELLDIKVDDLPESQQIIFKSKKAIKKAQLEKEIEEIEETEELEIGLDD